jgi:predicted Zn finger-like uncharacterized protein
MLVRCTGCGTTYRITDERVPLGGVKVKCPKCRVVFQVTREVQKEPETLGEKLFGKDVVRRPLVEEKVAHEEAEAGPGQAGVGQAEVVSPISAAAGVGQVEVPSPAGGATEVEAKEKAAEPKLHEKEPPLQVEQEAAEPLGKTKKEGDSVAVHTEVPSSPFQPGEEDPRNLARALVSDILFYNREKRDKGLAEGKVLAYLGREIARSWELYKDRVGIEKAIGAGYFREAVNEILGGDREIL